MSTSVSPAAADRVAVEDTSFTGFYTNMTPPERRTFWACAAGWALDGMDFMIYPLVIGTLIKLWSVDNTSASFAVTVTLLASAIGGWLAGFLSDRIGRVATLQITILWFSAFSLLCAFAENFNQLLAARTLLGFGFGGEWAAGAVLMGETIRAQYRGRAVGAVNRDGPSAGASQSSCRPCCSAIFLPRKPGATCSWRARCQPFSYSSSGAACRSRRCRPWRESKRDRPVPCPRFGKFSGRALPAPPFSQP